MRGRGFLLCGYAETGAPPRLMTSTRTGMVGAAAALLAGCTPFLACTDAGCDDGLIVRFSQPPAGAFRVEAVVPGDPAEYAFDCADAAQCLGMFQGLVAERVTVRLITAQGTRTREFQPRYQNVYPNGRRCGAACRQATVTFNLAG